MKPPFIEKVIEDIPSEKVAEIRKSFEWEGATQVISEEQSDGKYTIKAIFEEKVLEEKRYFSPPRLRKTSDFKVTSG